MNYSAIKGLKNFELLKCFDVIIGADDTDIHKPDPTPALMALKVLEAENQRRPYLSGILSLIFYVQEMQGLPLWLLVGVHYLGS